MLAAVIRFALVSCLVVACSAGALAADRFRFVATDRLDRLEAMLDEQGQAGYRLFDVARGVGVDGKSSVAVLLKHQAAGPVDFVVIRTAADFGGDETLVRLKELGAQGYRLDGRAILAEPVDEFWLPDTQYEDRVTMILERGPDAAPREIAAIPFGDFKKFHATVRDHARDGFEILALRNSGRRLRLFMERVDAGPRPAAGAKAEYRLLLPENPHGVRVKLKGLSDEGWRILAAEDQSVSSPPMLLLGRETGETRKLRYKFIRNPENKRLRGSFEKKLSARGRKGDRVSPGGFTATRLFTQRRTAPSRRGEWEYRVLSARRSPRLLTDMQALLDQGFRYLAMFHESGETTVVLEHQLKEER